MTSTPFSRLEWDEREYPSPERRSSIQYFPNGWIKRSILFVVLIGGTYLLIIYRRYPMNKSDFIWKFTQSAHPFSVYPWTWTCKENRCERSQPTNDTSIQSLKTCHMLCTTSPLWPEPKSANLSATTVPISTNGFSLQIDKSPSNEVTEHINGTFVLFTKDIKKLDQGHNSKGGKNVVVHVRVYNDKDPRLLLRTIESYTLTVRTEGDTVTVIAEGESFVGARHALETLTQLIWFDATRQSLVVYETADVKDGPKFHYRGLLLDTARNFFPVEDITRTLDAMAASKLNTFHWHATDSQSFPLKLRSMPQLALFGAYSRREVYSVDDIKTVVNHARLKGIRVVIEVDAPAHVGRAWTWGKEAGLGDLAYCVEEEPWHNYCGEPPCGQLNPTNDNVFKVLEEIYKEILELTGIDDVFHLGGDEVNTNCWKMNMKSSSFDHIQIWFDFTQKALLALKIANKGKVPDMTILWSSRLTNNHFYLERMKNFTVQLWGDSKSHDIKAIPEAGIRSIVSNVNAWYLDCGFGSWRDASDGHCKHRSWVEMYEHCPWRTMQNIWPIVGGTACMWTEQVGGNSLDSRVWPRAAAFAERLWSDPDHAVTDDEFIRLDMHRQRLVDRGVGAERIWNQWCTENPNHCLETDEAEKKELRKRRSDGDIRVGQTKNKIYVENSERQSLQTTKRPNDKPKRVVNPEGIQMEDSEKDISVKI